jgi:hypothetical protein
LVIAAPQKRSWVLKIPPSLRRPSKKQRQNNALIWESVLGRKALEHVKDATREDDSEIPF